jgi:hypothetical protein
MTGLPLPVHNGRTVLPFLDWYREHPTPVPTAILDTANVWAVGRSTLPLRRSPMPSGERPRTEVLK